MEKKEIIIGCFIVLILFIISLQAHFSGYMILFFIAGGIVLFFYMEHILAVLQTGGSVKSIIVTSIIGAIIASIVYGAIFMYENKQEINRNWATYKCRPYVMPVAGILIGPGDTSPTETFKDCMWNINKTFFDVLISPYVNILNVITGILKGFNEDIQNVRKMTTYLRDNMEEMAEDVYQKIHDAYSRIAFLFKTFLRLFSKLFDIFRDLFDVLLYSFYSVASIWNGPIGGVATFFCFDAKTEIALIGGIRKPIREIVIGDVIDDIFKSRIYGIMKFDGAGVPMYYYGDILVSGNHIVYEDGRWTRVANSRVARRADDGSNIIYCLSTDTSLIKIGDTIFCDYFETGNPEINGRIQETVLTYLNHGNKLPLDSRLSYGIDTKIGFDGDTPVRMAHGGNRPISQIKIGDELYQGGRVLGKIRMAIDIPIYNYRGGNIFATGNTLVRENSRWIPVKISRYSIPIVGDMENPGKIYHLVTEKHLINAGNGYIFTDFIQSADDGICNYIDNYVLDKLNN